MPHQRNCRQCGKPFTSRQANQAFCAPRTAQERKVGKSACNWRWTAAQARKRNGSEGRYRWSRTCVVCGDEFETHTPTAKYCTAGTADSCEARAKLKPGYIAPTLRGPTVPATRRDVAAYKRSLRLDPCSYCGVKPCRGVDHIEPESGVGRDDWTNYTGCCQRCNATKQALPLLQAMLWMPASRDYHDLRRVLWAQAA